MPGTASYIDNKGVWIVFNSVALGFTEPGGVTVNITPNYVPRTTEQTGEAIIEEYFNGATVTVDVNLSEVNNRDNWLVAFGHSELQVDDSTPPENRWVMGSSTSTDPWVGQKASDVAHTLILRPVADYTDTSTETEEDLVIPLAFVRNVGEIVNAITAGNTLPLTFSALFDTTASDGLELIYRGLNTDGGTWSAA